jgi:hypothetical protein
VCFIHLWYPCPPKNIYATTIAVISTQSASKVESHVARIHLLFSHVVQTPIPWGIIHCLPSVHSSSPPRPTQEKNTRRNPQSSKLVYLFLRRGGIIQKPQHLYKNANREPNRKQKHAVRSSRAGLLDIRQYKMGIILFVVAMSRPDTNASLGIVRKTGTNSSSSKWCII